MSKNNKIIYQLTVEDIQNVANQELGRSLSDVEIESIIEPIAEKIPWYDAICNTITENYKEFTNSEERN
jgi:hypothetical protein